MDSEKVIKRDNEYVLHTYNRNPIVLEKGHGLRAAGPEGQQYLDFTSGIGVNSLGYCDLDWAEAVSEQGKALAGKQDELAAEVDLAALAGLGNTLADEEGETRNRKARAKITQRQEAQANEHQALAREVTQFRAEFAGAAADTAAELTAF